MRALYTETIRYEEVSMTGTKSVKCAGGCGRTLKRQRKFSQTINPWNRKANGEIKSHVDIYPELRRDIEQWQAKPETCKHCEEGGSK
jgi:hypothetical protein